MILTAGVKYWSSANCQLAKLWRSDYKRERILALRTFLING